MKPLSLLSARSFSPQLAQRRTLLSWIFPNKATPPPPPPQSKPVPILAPDDLFHPFSSSPIPELREKALRIKSSALCPVSLEKYKIQRYVEYDCPDCGWPTHYNREMWEEDEERGKYCSRLREVNEDEHDIRSGRDVEEYKLPGPQPDEEAIAFSNWDLFFYTRKFPAIDSDRSRRHVTKLLTYPLTIASILHEYSPYTTRSRRLTTEGLRSMTALRQSLHPVLGAKPTLARPILPIRIFVLGARAESTLPPHVLSQINYCFPRAQFQIYMIGPEADIPFPKSSEEIAMSPRGSLDRHTYIDLDGSGKWGVPSKTTVVARDLTVINLRGTYEDVHEKLGPFDPYHDVYFAFSPGFGFPTQPPPSAPRDPSLPPTIIPIYPGPPQSTTIWHKTLTLILKTKCSLFCTGFSPADVERDIGAMDVTDGVTGEFDWILMPGENTFRCDKWEVLESDPRVMIKNNWGVWGIRGKRYEVKERWKFFG